MQILAKFCLTSIFHYDIIPKLRRYACRREDSALKQGAFFREIKGMGGVAVCCRSSSRAPGWPGVKQTRRAIEDGRAARVFLAEDADPRVTGPVEELCREKDIPVERVSQMKELGSACGIAVPSAVAALLA
mgnify:CR=1 FL=1